MSDKIRDEARKKDIPAIDLLLQYVKRIEHETQVPRTIFAACPNSLSVIQAALRSAKRNNAPIKFAATLNQVDLDGGYTGQEWLVKSCCRYIWENPEVLAARSKLYANLERHGVEASEVVLSKIEKEMDRYFVKFNLVDILNLVDVEEKKLKVALF